jgi:hypothetical protein
MRSGRRPLQNRVTPFGDVVAIAQRGLFIGNRGIIHDPASKTPETPSSIFPSICHIVCSFAGGRRSTGMFFRRFPGAASIKFGGTGR